QWSVVSDRTVQAGDRHTIRSLCPASAGVSGVWPVPVVPCHTRWGHPLGDPEPRADQHAKWDERSFVHLGPRSPLTRLASAGATSDPSQEVSEKQASISWARVWICSFGVEMEGEPGGMVPLLSGMMMISPVSSGSCLRKGVSPSSSIEPGRPNVEQ